MLSTFTRLAIMAIVLSIPCSSSAVGPIYAGAMAQHQQHMAAADNNGHPIERIPANPGLKDSIKQIDVDAHLIQISDSASVYFLDTDGLSVWSLGDIMARFAEEGYIPVPNHRGSLYLGFYFVKPAVADCTP